MSMILRRPMFVLGTTVLLLQAVFMPIGMVYAEKTMDTEVQEQVELPPMTNYLDEQESEPQFHFTESRIQGTVEELVQVAFFSDQEVTEVRVTLPEEAQVLTEQLPVGISVKQVKSSEEWVIQAQRAQNTFVLPLVFDSIGSYEIVVERIITTNIVIGYAEEIDYTSDQDACDDDFPREEITSIKDNLQEESKTDEVYENDKTAANKLSDTTLTEIDVSSAPMFIQAINTPRISVINVVAPIIISERVDVSTDVEIDLKGNSITLNNSGELRLVGSDIKKFTLKNGTLNGNSTVLIGDGQSAHPTVATRQLEGLETHLQDLTVHGNNFYNGLMTDVKISGNVNVDISNTGFRAKNFRVSSGANLILNSTSSVRGSGTDQARLGEKNGVTMGAYANTGTSKVFEVESGGRAEIRVDQGANDYNNGVADFTELNVYGELIIDTHQTSIRTTSSHSAVDHAFINITPDSTFFMRTATSSVYGVFFTYPFKFSVDNPKSFDIIAPNARNMVNMYRATSEISFKNMGLAVWNSGQSIDSTPSLSDSSINSLAVTNMSTARGTLTTDSSIFSNNFNLNSYRRISGIGREGSTVTIDSLSEDRESENSRIITGYAPPGSLVHFSGDPAIPVMNFHAITSFDGKYRYELPNGRFFTGGSTVTVEATLHGITRSASTIVEAKKIGAVTVKYQSMDGYNLADPQNISGIVGEHYVTEPKEIDDWKVTEIPENATGIFAEEPITVIYIYEQDDSEVEPSIVPPVDPLAPEVEVDPENKPELPANQGQLSIDFISSFNFGSQTISAKEKTYSAQPQRLLNEDETVSDEVRPNYVQVSDRRSENERGGWQLAVTQREQFTAEGKELTGARLRFTNQELVTAQGGNPPSLQETNPLILVPGNKRTLIRAEGDEGPGTWIYRFGDQESADKSVLLDIPAMTNPDAITYSTTLVWELSSVPGN